MGSAAEWKNFVLKNMDHTLIETDFHGLGRRIQGKVRDVYVRDDQVVLITTDRQSAFDRVLAAIPFKGQVLNQLAAWWFEHTADIVANHVRSVPDPNITVARPVRIVPVEMVVRGYITGVTSTSLWQNYSRGVREFCGNRLPEGLRKNQQLERPLLTPTTKSETHDESISPAEIVARGLLTQAQWDELAEIALRLFARGQEIALRGGLILVDTKYEFGWDGDGRLCLADEIHTPDSSRFWKAATYAERHAAGQEPESFDKEFLRLWFVEHCDPYRDAELPKAPDDLVAELSARYIECYEALTGCPFEPQLQRPVLERMADHLKPFLSNT